VAIGITPSLPGKSPTPTRPTTWQVATITDPSQPLLALTNLILNTKTIPLDQTMAYTQLTLRTFEP